VDCLNQAVAAADRAAKLTRQLLAFSRKQVLQYQPLNLSDVVGNMSKMLQRIIGEDMPRGGETILLVEDTSWLRELIRCGLQTCGYTVLAATHGEEAIQVAAAHLVSKVRAMLDNETDTAFLRKHGVTSNQSPPGSTSA
jgi:PleD family two-component response regulator